MKNIAAAAVLCLPLLANAAAYQISCNVSGAGSLKASYSSKQIDFDLDANHCDLKSIGNYQLYAFVENSNGLYGVSAYDTEGNQVAGKISMRPSLNFKIYTAHNLEDLLNVSCRRLY